MPDVIIPGFGVISFANEYKPGDTRPENAGYGDWFEWAEVQHKAGLVQKCCGRCVKWKFPQELSGEIDETPVFNKRGRQIGIDKSPICIGCAPWLKTRSNQKA